MTAPEDLQETAEVEDAKTASGSPGLWGREGVDYDRLVALQQEATTSNDPTRMLGSLIAALIALCKAQEHRIARLERAIGDIIAVTPPETQAAWLARINERLTGDRQPPAASVTDPER